MLQNKMFLKIIIITVICLTINSNLIYAADENVTEDITTLKITDEQYTVKVTAAELESIDKILEYINNELKAIDEKLSNSRILPEYEKYPAVRLNIDTPYFGIYSIINSKLKIRDGVSTVDIANGYSIRSVINKKSIKIESFEVSNVVVITRDLKIDETMSSSDAQTCITKLLDYLVQAKSVNKFLDKQLSAMITGYFSKDKFAVIQNINEQIDEIEENLKYSSIELSCISAITENDVNEDTNTLYGYKDEIVNIKAKVKSVLTSQTKLDTTYEDILKTNVEVKLFRFNVNKKYLNVTNDLDIEKAANLITTAMNNEITYLQNFIDKSKIEITASAVEENAENLAIYENTADSSITTQAKKYEILYKTSSESIIKNMQKDLDKLNVILEEIISNKVADEVTVQSTEIVSTEIVSAEVESQKVSDERATLEEILQLYIGFLNKENVFLTENSKVNITEVKKLKDFFVSSFEDIDYIYINISDVLTNISDNYESKSIISNIRTSNSLKQVIDRVILISNNFNIVASNP